jgi:hypothetical protein
MRYPPMQLLRMAVFASLILFVITLALSLSAHSKYDEVATEYKTVQLQAQEYGQIKKRWSIEDAKGDFEYFKNHPKVTKQEKRGDKYLFEFDNLNGSEFDHLSNKILNSMVMIKKLTLRRESGFKGSIIVEFEG